MKGKRWIVAKEFSGTPNEENLTLEEFDLPETLNENEVLLQAVYWSVDPYMRIFPAKEGDLMRGEQLAEVVRTRNGCFPLGSLVSAKRGWTSHFVSNGDDLNYIQFDYGGVPLSYMLGTLGMPGGCAYFTLERCAPKAGETILISAAAGAVGNTVGQLAKIKGLTVIGLVGSDEKVDWCKNELGFDHVFNYKSVNFSEAIASVAPDGVDIYFDNVGGDYYHTIVNKHMKNKGRVLVFGSIQNYNETEPKLYPATNFSILMKNLTIMGDSECNESEWPSAFMEMKKLIQDGKIKVKETKYYGIEQMRDAFYGLFKGENIGKAIVKSVIPEDQLSHYRE